MQIKIPVDFTVESTNFDDGIENFDKFLKFCYKEYARQFGIVDYELPVGYPVEENGCNCT